MADGFVSSTRCDKRSSFDFDEAVPLLDGDIPRPASCGFHMHHIVRFSGCLVVLLVVVSTRDEMLTA